MRESVKRLVTVIVAASFVWLGFTTQVVLAEDLELSKVYHVYADDQYLGIVDNKDIVEDFKKEMIASKQQESDFTYMINEEISYVSEKVFSEKVENQEIGR